MTLRDPLALPGWRPLDARVVIVLRERAERDVRRGHPHPRQLLRPLGNWPRRVPLFCDIRPGTSRAVMVPEIVALALSTGFPAELPRKLARIAACGARELDAVFRLGGWPAVSAAVEAR